MSGRFVPDPPADRRSATVPASYAQQGVENLPDHDDALSEAAWQRAGAHRAAPGWSGGAAPLRRVELMERDALVAAVPKLTEAQRPAVLDRIRELETKVDAAVRVSTARSTTTTGRGRTPGVVY